jgi:hypothetical protein
MAMPEPLSQKLAIWLFFVCLPILETIKIATRLFEHLITMRKSIPLEDFEHLGRVFRAARKLQHLRQDEIGRLSHSFIGEVEMGKSTAQIGKVFEALRELGLKLHVELPPGIDLRSLENTRTSKK